MEQFGGENGFFRTFIFLCGLFTVFCATQNYDWFMENRKTWLFVKLFGRNGARVVYILIGLFLMGLSIAVQFRPQL